MKVINEWDGAARTPTRIIQDWYADYRDDIHECGIDGFHATELMAALAPLFAAGPWRTDVENAPRDGSEVLIAWGSVKIGISAFHWDDENYVWSDGSDGYVEHDYVIAFAAINPPEIEG